MTFTPLHQAIGAQPGPIISEMLDELIAQGVEEGDDLDFKKTPPDQKALAQSDFPKDIAAFANSGGGALVFGMAEEVRKATERVDVGEISEAYERTLRSVAVSHIHPPVFALDVVQVGEDGQRALVVVVPASLDGPHLIYRNDYFGAPIRNHADTVWMRERQLEQMYRARFDARSRADQAIDDLYAETAAGRDTNERAWLIAVAVPQLPHAGGRLDQYQARLVIESARRTALEIASAQWVHPFESIDHLNPRRGMRRWVLRNTKDSGQSRWKAAWISVLDNGSVTLAMAVGGYRHPSGEGHVPGNEVYGRSIECCVADLMVLLSELAHVSGSHGEYDLRLGIEWTGQEHLLITTVDWGSEHSIPLARFTPLRASVRPDAQGDDLQRQIYEVALDAVNQGGLQGLQLIANPDLQ